MKKQALPLSALLAVLICSLLLFAQSASGPSGSLAFRRSGDIWVQHLPDGVPNRVSQGGGTERPQWSVSGEWLSYRQNGKLVVAPVNGNRREARLLDADAVWSPLKDELAFVDHAGLCLLSFDGNSESKRVLVPETRMQDPADPVWSPDGTRLAFLAQHRLWRVNVDGSDVQEVFSAADHDGLVMRGWSADGRYLVLSVDPDSSASVAADGLALTFVPVDGGKPHIFAASVLLYSDFLSVSLDRLELLVSAGGGRESWQDKRVTLIDAATGKFTFLTNAASSAVSPSWSTDGRYIVYVSAPAAGTIAGEEQVRQALSKRRIWTMTGDGKQMRQLTADSRYRDEYPSWSRNGYILFVRLDAKDNASLWTVNPNRGALLQIVENLDLDSGYYGHIEWDKYLAWHRN